MLDKHYVCSVDATELLSNVDKLMTGGLFTYVYDQIFGNVPCAAAMMPFPKDPPLPKKD